jgi:hypothetical protein
LELTFTPANQEIEQCVNITTLQDEILESDEQLTVQIQSSDDAVIISDQNVTLTIVDDEGKLGCC